MNRQLLKEAILDERFVNRHLPGTAQVEALLRRGDAAHVFTDRTTMDRVAQEIISHGEYLGSARGFERWGLQFEESVGYRIAPDGARTALYYGEIKMQGGRYHVVPRTRPAIGEQSFLY